MEGRPRDTWAALFYAWPGSINSRSRKSRKPSRATRRLLTAIVQRPDILAAARAEIGQRLG